MDINQHSTNTSDKTVIDDALRERRERTFLVLAAFFICAMTLLNVVGITRFVQLGPVQLAIGVLPYPLTFLCTDLICELYGKARANFVVTLGLILNVFIITILSIGNALPAVPESSQPPWQVLQLAESITLPNGNTVSDSVELFALIYQCTSGAVFASMMAYLAAQYIDVRIFHWVKRLTKGKHLWLRNNVSTITSQLVDSTVVIGVTFGSTYLAGDIAFRALLILMASNYAFKLLVALIDTVPFYLLVYYLERYLNIRHREIH